MPIETCDDHEYLDAIDPDGPVPRCQDCGKLFWTTTCKECEDRFLDLDAYGEDDVMAATQVTHDGILMCERCARDYDQRERRRKEQEYFQGYEHPYENRLVHEPSTHSTAGPADDVDGRMTVPDELTVIRLLHSLQQKVSSTWRKLRRWWRGEPDLPF